MEAIVKCWVMFSLWLKWERRILSVSVPDFMGNMDANLIKLCKVCITSKGPGLLFFSSLFLPLWTSLMFLMSHLHVKFCFVKRCFQITEYWNWAFYVEMKFICFIFHREPESTTREVMFAPQYQLKLDKKPSHQRSYLWCGNKFYSLEQGCWEKGSL